MNLITSVNDIIDTNTMIMKVLGETLNFNFTKNV